MLNNTFEKSILFFQKISVPFGRGAVFVIFFWFGFLKIIGQSPASPLVQALFEKTISFMSFDTFIILFGVFECAIGILFLIKGLEKIAIPLFFIHMITTFGPLVLLSTMTWSSFMVPTLEGQYIIKNLVLISAVITIGASLRAPSSNPTLKL